MKAHHLALLVALGGCGGRSDLALGAGGATSSTGSSGATSTTTGSGGGLSCAPGEKVSCYDGPMGTEGIGICKGGQRTCAADGAGYGACEGQVLPKQELCSTAEDDDCDGSTTPCANDVSWCRVYSPPTVLGLFGIGVDGARNAVVGLMAADLEIGGQAYYGPTVIKLSPEGEVVWARSFQTQSMGALAVAPDGSIAFAGTFTYWAAFGTGDLHCPANLNCPYVVKLAPDGETVFARSYLDDGTSPGATLSAVGVDAAGGVVFSGRFWKTFDCGAGPALSSSDWDVYVTKLSPEGDCLWSRQAYAAQNPWLSLDSLAVDTAGNTLLAGTFKGTVALGGISTSAPNGAYFVTRLDTGGNAVFARAFDSVDLGGGVVVAPGPAGEALLAGTFGGVLDLGGGPLVSSAQNDVFVAKLDPSGNHLFSHGYSGGFSQTLVSSIGADPQGGAFVAGMFLDTVDLGAGLLKSEGAEDILLGHLDAAGATVASKRYGDVSSQRVARVVVNALGTPILAGVFQGTMDMGAGVVQAKEEDVYVCQVAQ